METAQLSEIAERGSAFNDFAKEYCFETLLHEIFVRILRKENLYPVRDGTVLDSQLIYLKPFPPTFFFVVTAVLCSNLQMDTNFRLFSTAYLSFHQQSTNGENSEQPIEFQTRTLDNRTFAEICHARFYCEFTSRGDPLTAIKLLLFITLLRINLFHRFFFVK